MLPLQCHCKLATKKPLHSTEENAAFALMCMLSSSNSTCLEVRAAVVDDDVGDGLQIAVVQRAQALAQLALGAVRRC